MDGYELVRLQPEQVNKAGDTMTGSLTMTNGGRFIGDLDGIASSSNKWEVPVDITIGATTKQVDGTNNLSWALNEIISPNDFLVGNVDGGTF